MDEGWRKGWLLEEGVERRPCELVAERGGPSAKPAVARRGQLAAVEPAELVAVGTERAERRRRRSVEVVQIDLLRLLLPDLALATELELEQPDTPSPLAVAALPSAPDTGEDPFLRRLLLQLPAAASGEQPAAVDDSRLLELAVAASASSDLLVEIEVRRTVDSAFPSFPAPVAAAAAAAALE